MRKYIKKLSHYEIFCYDPPGLLERLDNGGRGVLILLEALLLLCRCVSSEVILDGHKNEIYRVEFYLSVFVPIL